MRKKGWISKKMTLEGDAPRQITPSVAFPRTVWCANEPFDPAKVESEPKHIYPHILDKH